MRKFIKEYRAALDEKAQKDEGNAFTAALNAAREKGDTHFTVAGKKYKCEDYDENGEMKKKDMKKKDDDDDDDDDDDQEEAMDPVNKKELKGKHADRKDKDIDNDGDVDASDKYLHRRRKAISKADTEDEPKKNGGEEEVVMNPKKGKKEATKESTIRERLMSIWEDAAGKNRKADQNKDEESTERNASAKKMKDGHPEDKSDDKEEKGHDDATAAGRAVKSQAKARGSGDATTGGDRNIVNKIAAAYKGMTK